LVVGVEVGGRWWEVAPPISMSTPISIGTLAKPTDAAG
jgi:hypothetical protein